jgi:hypothetical protein
MEIIIIGPLLFFISTLALSVKYKDDFDFTIITGSLSIGIICLLFILSFTVDFTSEVVPYSPTRITELEKSIVVESKEQDFTLIHISDRTVLKAKKFYIQTYKNAWGMPYASKNKLTWEN